MWSDKKTETVREEREATATIKEIHGIDQFTQAHAALELPSAIP